MKPPLTLVDQQKSPFTTTLPLHPGSQGYDTRQDYLIKGHLPSDALTSIYGPSGSYKSFLAIAWACHIATGMPWAGRRVTQGSILYIVGEGGIGVPRRIKAWERTFNGDSPIGTLWRIDCPVFPASPESAEQVVLAAREVENQTGMAVRLVVLDTLARCFGGSDENAARDMGAFIQGCDYIKAKTRATVLIIHHSGKDEEKGARGSSAFRAALDAEFHVRREESGQGLVLNCTKMKDAEEPPRRAYTLNRVPLYTDDDEEQIVSLVLNDEGHPPEADNPALDPYLASVPRLTNNHVALWQCVRSRTAAGEPCTRTLVRDDLRAMGVDVSKKFTRWLDKLANDGLLTVDGEIIRPRQANREE
ncbi:helicase RepA family protein [Sodalis sp. RH14]|uniref:helicase RepA family protein n=1 Tax=Sodalis sp. RH14 TaxID=3394329 RepID=UPI0039B4EEA4